MNRKIKVKFSFRRQDHKKWYSDFFIGILEGKYQVEIDEENPDFIFHEAHLVDAIEYSGVRIAVAAENVRIDFNISDYGIGFDHMIFQDRYLRYPLYLLYEGSLKAAEGRHCQISNQSPQDFLKRKFCNFLVSNGNATQFRTQFFKDLSLYKHIESGGKYLNNIGEIVTSKLDWQSGFKFSLCFENSSTSGYLTEKLIHAFAAFTVPIYWGDPDALGSIENGKGGVNPDAVIWVNPHSTSEAIQKIQDLDSNPELYLKMLNEPLFLDVNHSNKFRIDLEKFLFSIFDTEKDLAFRRGFGQIRMRVEKRNIARSSILKSFINYLKKRIKF